MTNMMQTVKAQQSMEGIAHACFCNVVLHLCILLQKDGLQICTYSNIGISMMIYVALEGLIF